MKNLKFFLFVAPAIISLADMHQVFAADPVSLEPGNQQFVRNGKQLCEQHCASCHGKDLQGEPNWKVPKPNGRLPAPPHDMSGHTWHHSDQVLFEITKQGTEAYVGNDYKSDMIGFKDLLSDEEIIAVLSFIKSTWPIRDQKRHDLMNQRTK